MRKYAILAALSATMLTCPAYARDGDFYIGADLGLTVSADTDQIWVPAATAGTTGHMDTDHKLGFDGAAFVGYDLGPVRVEAEASYKSTGISEITSDFTGPVGLTAGSQAASGKVGALAFMGNAMADFGREDDLSFFVGGGAGIARVKFSEMAASPGAGILLDHWDWRFAWQAFAGIRKPVSRSVDAHVRYRYFNVDDLETIGRGGRAVNSRFNSHSVVAGLTFNFW